MSALEGRVSQEGDLACPARIVGVTSLTSEAKNGAEIGRIVPLMGNMNVQVSTSFNVALSKVGIRQNQAVVPTLKQLLDATVDIINEFRGSSRDIPPR